MFLHLSVTYFSITSNFDMYICVRINYQHTYFHNYVTNTYDMKRNKFYFVSNYSLPRITLTAEYAVARDSNWFSVTRIFLEFFSQLLHIHVFFKCYRVDEKFRDQIYLHLYWNSILHKNPSKYP